MRDLDRGILGRGSHGLQQYEMLRRGTDALVNGILRVRRLLKQKRTADADGEHPPGQQAPECMQRDCWRSVGKGGVTSPDSDNDNLSTQSFCASLSKSERI